MRLRRGGQRWQSAGSEPGAGHRGAASAGQASQVVGPMR